MVKDTALPNLYTHKSDSAVTEQKSLFKDSAI